MVTVTREPGSAVPVSVGVAVGSELPATGAAMAGAAGGVVSTVHDQLGGEGSTLPAPSRARTASACGPSTTPSSWSGLAQEAKAPWPSKRHS